jgi:hypothetical protein
LHVFFEGAKQGLALDGPVAAAARASCWCLALLFAYVAGRERLAEIRQTDRNHVEDW